MNAIRLAGCSNLCSLLSRLLFPTGRKARRQILQASFSLFQRCFSAKLSLDFEFKHALNYAAKVMTEDFAECFIHLGCFGPTP
jgi:hypothetical protein